jgi:hypothetical protein
MPSGLREFNAQREQGFQLDPVPSERLAASWPTTRHTLVRFRARTMSLG